MFFAIKGNKLNGEKFIKEAILKGASVIVCSTRCNFKHKTVLIIKKNDLRSFLSEISSKFYKLNLKIFLQLLGLMEKPLLLIYFIRF